MVKRLVVEVVKVEGICPVFDLGHRCRVDKGYQLVTQQPLCMHALQALTPSCAALSRGIQPEALGLAGPGGAAYVQCLDPARYTGGGTVKPRIGSWGRLGGV